MEDKTTAYKGKNIDVTWDGRLCIHIGECGYSEGDLFVGGRDPWCQPDLVEDDNVKDVVQRCPSGALSYDDKTGSDNEQAASSNLVQVLYNGPLYIRGELEIENAPEDMSGVKFRAALCRCGQSKNKPFCDNSHLKAGFEDYAAVGENGGDLEQKGGTLSVKALANGPLMLSGHFALRAGSGRIAWQVCDGSHKQAGFEAE